MLATAAKFLLKDDRVMSLEEKWGLAIKILVWFMVIYVGVNISILGYCAMKIQDLQVQVAKMDPGWLINEVRTYETSLKDLERRVNDLDRRHQ